MRLRSPALFALLAWLTLSQAVRAQDALGKGADFSDDWDAILNLAPPPPTVAAGAPKRAARDGAHETKGATTRATSDEAERAERRAQREAERAQRDAEQQSQREQDAARRAERRAAREQEQQAEREAETARRAERRAARAAEEAGKKGERGVSASASTSPGKREQREKTESMDVPGFPPGGYEGLSASWHAPWPDNDAQRLAAETHSAPALSLHPVGRTQTPYVLIPQGPDGGFDEEQVAVASKAFGSWDAGPRVSARLLDLIYHAAKHFDVYHVHLVSGVRRDRSGSRHSHGLAADVVFPGVSDDELAAYFRPQGFCGVGIYTRADFVHIDVRERSYFWLDKSPPGRRMRIIPVRGDEAKAADEAAMARGQTGYVNPPRLEKALNARRKQRLAQAKLSQ
jgi:hypothetical protein